jgi:hypothetical protein
MIGFAVLLQWLIADRVSKAKKKMNRKVSLKK